MVNPLKREKSAASWIRHPQGLRNAERCPVVGGTRWLNTRQVARHVNCCGWRVEGKAAVGLLSAYRASSSEVKYKSRAYLGMVHSFVVKGEVPVHAMKAYVGVEVKHHAFVTSLD